jgi:hypothetical protein
LAQAQAICQHCHDEFNVSRPRSREIVVISDAGTTVNARRSIPTSQKCVELVFGAHIAQAAEVEQPRLVTWRIESIMHSKTKSLKAKQLIAFRTNGFLPQASVLWYVKLYSLIQY